MPDVSYIRDTPVESVTDTPVESVEARKPRENSNVVIPWEVGVDARLEHLDVRVFMILKGSQRDGGEVNMGRRLIARYACTSQRRVADSIGRLRETGWIKTSGKGGARASYHIATVEWNQPSARTSNFPERDCSKFPEVKRDLVRCPLCAAKCRQILKVGWCRRCNTNKNIEKISERVATRVVKAEIAQTEKTA